ncbi:MAG TPA: sigma-54 dependent transcriptional regulator [Spirochaetota bacterium]|nr:sigma-54 dependent transcriptional regulator [Spirochaetota bacterium]HOL58185.1 sigma-54 dependent transcriptional regulator [Spirochaetota bacterium]HPP05629.1 sigma-54 dependent transcriptional regulator [Spirochaetota bacterium]
MKANILIVDDEKNIRDGLKIALLRDGYNVFLASDGLEALEILKEEDIDVVITDLKMPNLDGDALMKRIIKEYFNIPVIILTGHGTVENAVQAMRDGAYDFLTKPLNLDKLSLIVSRAVSQRRLIIENRNLQLKIDSLGKGQVIGKSGKMAKIYEIVENVAPTKASVLIQGENGVGKELIANMIYELSNRKDKPFIKVHCAALAESLLESELFGHEKGAFTGAIKTKKGRFELADGGTLFLDEIGEISPQIQVKLLRVLQERSFERVGGEETISVDVRIISATNKDLKDLVEHGKFREDLYYRLNVVQLNIPPLRERREDIPLFISKFITDFSKENNKVIKDITARARACLYNYSWPGNIRELRNVIESAVVLCKNGVIDVDDLPPHIVNEEESLNILKIELPTTMKNIEKKAIISTLRITNGNKSKAAELLDLNRKTLHTKIAEYEIELEEDKS